MKTNRQYRYLWLKREGDENDPQQEEMSVHYKTFATPNYTITLVLAMIAFIWLVLKDSNQPAIGTPDRWLVVGIVLLTFIIGLKLLDSCFLAAQDYSRMKQITIWDFLMFFLIVAFSTGTIPKGVLTLTDKMRDTAIITCFIYSTLSVLAVCHFYSLGFFRLKSLPAELIDYPVEKRIHIFNMATMAIYFICFFLAGGYLKNYPDNYTPLFVISGVIIIVTILSIEHSRRLTNRPKLLLSNQCDSVDYLIVKIREYFSHCPWIQIRDDTEMRASILGNWRQEKIVKLVRVSKDKVPFLASVLYKHFGYVFHYVFFGGNESAELRREKITRIIEKLLKSGIGYGKMGYMNYYFIQNEEEVKVGVIGIRTSLSAPFSLYGVFQWVGVIGLILKEFGFGEFGRIRQRAEEIELNTVKVCGPYEWIINHLVIFDEGQGYGIATVRLFVNAFLREYTDNVKVNLIRVLVRENNKSAMSLFEKAGFNFCKSLDICINNDPMAEFIHGGKPIGKPMIMECKRGDLQKST